MKRKTFLAVLAACAALITAETARQYIKATVRPSVPQEAAGVVRLHILARSDSDQDQEMKLRVRDFVLERYGDCLTSLADRQEALDWLNGNLDGISREVTDFLASQGAGYEASAKTVNALFPERDYGGAVYPAGYYDALRIELGGGEGKNWWCVLYPPLCFVNVRTDPELTAASPARIAVRWWLGSQYEPQ